MKTVSCRSLLNYQEADFHQLDAVIKNCQTYLDAKQSSRHSSPLRIPSELVTPLQNLDDLITDLFEETGSITNSEQQMYLMQCKRTIATFYCWIQVFFELLVDSQPRPSSRRLAYEFYLHASYELRTPYFVLKGYAQLVEFDPQALDELTHQIYSSPFVPENQDKVEGISYWTGELGKFIDDLPRLRQEFSDT